MSTDAYRLFHLFGNDRNNGNCHSAAYNEMWVNMVRSIEIDVLAPQHGAIFNSKELAVRFIDWIDSLTVGADIMGDSFIIPN